MSTRARRLRTTRGSLEQQHVCASILRRPAGSWRGPCLVSSPAPSPLGAALHTGCLPPALPAPVPPGAPWRPLAGHRRATHPACSWPKDSDEWKRLLAKAAPWVAAALIAAAAAYGYNKVRGGGGGRGASAAHRPRAAAEGTALQLWKALHRVQVPYPCALGAACRQRMASGWATGHAARQTAPPGRPARAPSLAGLA